MTIENNQRGHQTEIPSFRSFFLKPEPEGEVAINTKHPILYNSTTNKERGTKVVGGVLLPKAYTGEPKGFRKIMDRKRNGLVLRTLETGGIEVATEERSASAFFERVFFINNEAGVVELTRADQKELKQGVLFAGEKVCVFSQSEGQILLVPFSRMVNPQVMTQIRSRLR